MDIGVDVQIGVGMGDGEGSRDSGRCVMIGDIVHASTNMQFKVGRVIAIQGSMISIEWESPLVIRKDGRGVVILVQLDAVPMRILGTITETNSA